MKILHVNTNYLNNPLHQNMINFLNKTGIENTVFVPTHNGSTRVITPNEDVILSECFGKWDRISYYYKQTKILSSIKKSVSVKNYDIIHAYTLFTDGNVAYNLSKETGIPYVVAVRNTDLNTFLKYRFYLRKRGIEILKNASAVFFLSSAYKKRLFEKYLNAEDKEIIDSKSYIMPNGIDDFWLENEYSDKDYSAQSDAIKVACVGAIDSNKNMISVAKAIDIIRTNGANVELHIAGRIIDKSIYNLLMQYDFVKYHGVLPKEKLIYVYRNCDVFALTSFYESFGMVYVEAMSQGLPVIYTKNEGFDGNYKNGEVGYCTLPANSEEISEKIMLAYNNQKNIGQNCICRVREFSWTSIVNKYSNIYNDILNKRG